MMTAIECCENHVGMLVKYWSRSKIKGLITLAIELLRLNKPQKSIPVINYVDVLLYYLHHSTLANNCDINEPFVNKPSVHNL